MRDDPVAGEGTARLPLQNTRGSQDSGSEGGSGPNTACGGNSQATPTEFLLGAKSRAGCEVFVNPQASAQKPY